MEPRHGRAGRVDPASTDVAVVARAVPAVRARSFLRIVERPRIAWSTADSTVAAGGAAVRLTAAGVDRFAAIRDATETVFAGLDVPRDVPTAARPRLFGGFAFHDEHDRPGGGPWQNYPGALFVLPEIQLTTTDDGAWLTAAATGGQAKESAAARVDRWSARLDSTPSFECAAPAGVHSRRPTPDRTGWRAQVETALEQITDGALRKVVLAQALTVGLDGEPVVPDVLSGLAASYPDCTRFLVEPDGCGAFFGATPERLVTVDGRSVRATVLAGSTARGDTEAEDAWLAEDLRESAKDRHEHEVVLDSIRDRLAPLSTALAVGDMRVRKLASVQHLETPVEATLSGDRHVLDLVERLHPTPAVGGMPRDAALRTIREQEPFDRGWYAAPVGWIDADGNGTFVVGLRSAVAGGETATLFAGNGIVADSDPDREWDEIQLKYHPILDELS